MEGKLELKLPGRGDGKERGTGKFLLLIVALLLVSLLNLFFTVRGARDVGCYKLPPGKLMDVALRLEKQGLYEPAVEVWKEYLETSGPGSEESARIWYRIGKLYQEGGSYSRAVAAYYMSEEIARLDRLEHEISTRTAECLERMGRFAALDYELERRTSLASKDSLPSDEVLAEIGPQRITRAGLNAMIEAEIESELAWVAGDLGPEERKTRKKKLMDSVRGSEQIRAWLERLIAEEVLYRKAREEKLGEREEFRRMLDGIERKLLAQKYLEQEYAKRIVITPDDLKSYYEAHKGDYKEEGKQKSFDEVKDEIYRKLKMERERDVQRRVIGELMDRYDVVIHTSRLVPQGSEGGNEE